MKPYKLYGFIKKFQTWLLCSKYRNNILMGPELPCFTVCIKIYEISQRFHQTLVV
jgi:hypothetical protein